MLKHPPFVVSKINVREKDRHQNENAETIVETTHFAFCVFSTHIHIIYDDCCVREKSLQLSTTDPIFYYWIS